MGITYEEGISHSDETSAFFSKGSRKEPFANFLNNVGFGTVVLQGLLGALSLADKVKERTEPLRTQNMLAIISSPEALANEISIGLPIGGAITAFFLLYESYKRKPEEEKAVIIKRVAEVSKNPLTIFKKTALTTSSS